MPRPHLKFCLICDKEIPFKIEINGEIVERVYKRKHCYDCHAYQGKDKELINYHCYKDEYYCIKCDTTKTKDKFYLDRDGKRTFHYCRDCQKSYVIMKQQSFKAQCVEYKGGKCEICGYDKCLGAMDFHHLDPNKKDFAVSGCNTIIMTLKIKDELDKCQLLCSNCHREFHYENIPSTKSLGTKRPNKEYKCRCGKTISHNATYCKECSVVERRMMIKPTKEELNDLIWKIPMIFLSEQFRVTEQTLRHWCKEYGLERPGVGYWTKFRNKKYKIGESNPSRPAITFAT